jgi:hypothetical protein
MAQNEKPEQALTRTLAAKAARRQELARLPYEQKIAMSLSLRPMARSMKQASTVAPANTREEKNR